MARYCIDASVLLTLLLDSRNQVVRDFWLSISRSDDLVVPRLLLPEGTSVLRRAVFMRVLSPPDGQVAIDQMLSMPFRVIEDAAQFPRAFALAAQFQHKKAYDMQYLAVAELTGSELVTSDRGLRHAATQIGVPVRFLT